MGPVQRCSISCPPEGMVSFPSPFLRDGMPWRSALVMQASAVTILLFFLFFLSFPLFLCFPGRLLANPPLPATASISPIAHAKQSCGMALLRTALDDSSVNRRLWSTQMEVGVMQTMVARRCLGIDGTRTSGQGNRVGTSLNLRTWGCG